MVLVETGAAVLPSVSVAETDEVSELCCDAALEVLEAPSELPGAEAD